MARETEERVAVVKECCFKSQRKISEFSDVKGREIGVTMSAKTLLVVGWQKQMREGYC